MLYVFGGLPGAGKTTLARALAQARGAVYLRIDVIEQALLDSGALAGDVGPAGYVVAYGLAESNLRLGHDVVADSVNPVSATRDHWRKLAQDLGAPILEIEVVCSDPAEHRRRVETRAVDIAGLTPPSWEEVQRRDYAPWTRERLVLDTAGRTIEASYAALIGLIEA
jgi:predicted kinase